MIRISGGVCRGRQLRTPGDMIRPTQEKVRQALFSCLAARVPGCRFLDLFAGCGSVGLEAWSRGAGFVCWVEKDPRVAAVLKHNVALLCRESGAETPGQTRVVVADAVRFVDKATIDGPFDIIFADPPYAERQRDSWSRKILQVLEGGSTLTANGILVVEQGVGEPALECAGLTPLEEKAYGGTLLRFWKK
ncbi:MAG: 16S rRNA (guanine(966)-N(2))-methyltransferase RsmD [bacterium]